MPEGKYLHLVHFFFLVECSIWPFRGLSVCKGYVENPQIESEYLHETRCPRILECKLRLALFIKGLFIYSFIFFIASKYALKKNKNFL